MTETALASRADEPLSCGTDPFSTSSSADSTSSTPLFTPAPSPDSSSSSGSTPAFLDYTPGYGDDADAMVCRAPDPVSTSTPSPTSTPARPSSPRPGRGSRASGDRRSGRSDATSRDSGARGSGSPGSTRGGSPAERADTPGAATSGAAARRPGAGGAQTAPQREAESEAGKRRLRDQTLRRLAMPPAAAARGAARIGREPLFLDVPTQTWSAPRSLDAPLPEPQAQKTPQQPGQQAESSPGKARAAYAASAGQAEALFDRLMAAAAGLAREADGQLQALTDRNESQLGQALARLEEDHAQHSVDAARSRDAVLERIASRTDILRAYVVEQANGALGRMSALRLKLLAAITTLRKPAVEAAGALSKAVTAAGTAGQTARDALETLKTDKMAQFRSSGKFVETETRGSAMIEAMLEAAVQFAAPRIAADIKALSERWDKVRNFAEPIAACGPCEADGKLAGLQGHADNLGVAGPRAIRSARDGALKSIDQTEQQLNLSVLEAHHQAEGGLAERHDQTRLMLIGQSSQATLGLRRDLERSGRQQISALVGVAATQPAALKMIEQEVDRAARATPTRAATLAVQSAARLQRNVANVAARHPAGVLGMAERNRASRLDRAIAGGREQLAMVSTFGQQQKQFVGETFDQVDRSMEESLYDMAGVPGQVGKSCDSMISRAREAVTEAMDKIPPQIAFIAQKLTDACDGLVPISPDSPPANPEAGHDPAPEEMVCRADDAPNMSLFDPGASMSTMSSSSSSSPLMSVAPQTGTSSSSGGGATASAPGAGGGTPAPAPASCAPCDTARTTVRDRAAAAAAASGEGPGASGGGATGDTAPGTAGPANDDVGVSSARTNDRSANAYREHATPIGTKAVSAPNVDGFLSLVIANVEKKIGTQVSTAKSAIDRSGETGYGDMMKNALRGLTPLQGAALSESYLKTHKKDLASEITLHAYDGFGSGLTNTAAYNRDAALAALAGRADEAAINELEAAFNFSNETERIFDTMESMTHDQMRSFVAAHGDRLNELMDQLSDEDKVRFQLLMDGNTVRVRSMALRSAVDGVNQRYSWGNATDDRGFALGDAFAAAEHPSERWTLEGSGVVDTYDLEDPTVRQTREGENWDAVQRDIGNLDGVIDAIVRTNPSHAMSHPDDPPGAILLAYATRPLEVYAVQPPMQREGESREDALERQRLEYQRYNVQLGEQQTGEYGTFRMATTSINEYQYNYLNQSIRHGSQSREARGARALAQFRRSDGRPPDYKDVEQSLHSGIADAREGGNFEHGSREEADRDRLETFKVMEQYRRQIEGGATGEISGTAARAFFRDEMAAAYRDRPQDLDVALGVIDSDEGNMQAIVDQAIRREDPALLSRYLGRMDSQQIEAMVTEWNRRHPDGPGLWERLGVGRGNHWSIGNWNGAVFTGDEANALEIAMMGVPQTPKQKGEVALRILDQQIEQAGWLGRLTCSDQYDTLVAQANHLRDVMGVTEADLDEQGRIRAVDRDGNVIHMNFDASGQLRPGADSTSLNMLVAGSRIVADSYANAVDRMASILTTAIAVIGAIVLTVATFGAGASVLVAMAIAAGFGALTIAANASMRGGRYSRDDLTRDVVAAVVQIATAGLNVGIARGLAAGAKIAQGGAAAVRAASLGGRLAVTASRHALATAMITQGAMGGMSNLASTALDPAMRRRDDYGDQVMHSFFRGAAGGAVTAGVAHGLNTGASRLVQRFAVNRAINQAMSQGASRAAAIERAAEAAAKASSGRFMDYGVRAAVGATSATAGRATEMGYENAVGIRRHSGGDFYRELRHAFIQNAIQGLAEGGALRATRTRMASHIERQAELMDSERRNAADAAGLAFDREMARRGITPEPSEARPGERPPAAPRTADEDDGPAVRTADEDGRRRPPAAANDDDAGTPRPGPVRTRAALAEGEMLRMGRIAEGSVFIHPETTNLHAANDNFGRLVNADPTREVAVYHNPVTGEYLVIQGGERSVALVRHDGEIKGPGISGFPAAALAARGGHWELRTHFHPNRPGQAHTNMARRLPSGQTGDLGVVEAEARHLARLSEDGVGERSSRIYFVDEGKLRYTDFSVRVDGDSVTYRVSFPDPATGTHGPPHTFGDIAQYHVFFEQRTGIHYPLAPRGVRARTADSDAAPAALDPARRVGGEAARLGDAVTPQNRTDAEFVAQRMNQAEGFEAARLSGRAHDSGIDPIIGRIASTSDAHTMVTGMGLVDRPDAMRRLAAIVNDPALSNTVKEQVLTAVRDATREALIRRGELEPHEPLLLTLHGAPDQRAGSIGRGGMDISLVQHKATDDFSHALYFTTQLSNAQTYAGRGGGTGAIFPGILRGRDMGMEVGPHATRPGSVIDVTPQGAHRAQWEAFVRANMHLLGRAEGMTSPERGMRMMEQTMEFGRQVFAENPANAGRTPTQRELFQLGSENYFARAPFADLDRFGSRAVLFDAFVRHMAETTGDARLGAPHMVLGELGGVMTSGIGHGDQQAIKSQRIADLLNEQLGVSRSSVRADDDDGSALRVRAVDEPDAAEVAAGRRSTEDVEFDRQIERAFRAMQADAEARGTTGERRGQPAGILPEGWALINGAIAAAARGDAVEAFRLRQMLVDAPDATRRILHEIATESLAGRRRTITDADVFAIEAELMAAGRSRADARTIARNIVMVAAPGTRLHQNLSEVPFSRGLQSSLRQPLERAAAERAGVRAAREFGDRRSTVPEKREIRRLLDVDTEGVVMLLTGEGSWRSRVMRFAMRRVQSGLGWSAALREAYLAARILRSPAFAPTLNRWQGRTGPLTPRLLAAMIRARPDALHGLARTSPQQLAEWFADYVLRQPRSAPPVIDADAFASYVQNRMISNVLPIVSEASSVWSNFRRLGLQLLKADAVQRGGANRPGLDLVGFSATPGTRPGAGDMVRVVIIDDKAYRGTDLDSVSAMTGLRLITNLRTTAGEIDAGVLALRRLGEHVDNPQIAEYMAGARAATRQMRNAANELAAITPPGIDMRSTPYLRRVAEILRRNNIVPLISSEYGNVRNLANWLRMQGFRLDDEYAQILARQLIADQRRAGR